MPKYIDQSDINNIANKLKKSGSIGASFGLPSFKERLQPYLWYLKYDTIDYTIANTLIDEGYSFACTSIWKNGILGRNFDWLYSNNIEAIITTPQTLDRYGSIGVCANIPVPELDMINNTVPDRYMRLLPFFVVDGINSKGVACSINVVPSYSNDNIQPAIEVRHTINSPSVVRYVLDNFDTAEKAVNNIKNYVKIVNNKELLKGGDEIHYLITDATSAYIVELIDNHVEIIDVTNKNAIITNFHNYGVKFNENGKIELPGFSAPHMVNNVDEYGAGIERYNTVIDNYTNINSVESMYDTLASVYYTNTFKEGFRWYSECTSKEYGYSVDSPAAVLEEVRKFIADKFASEGSEENKRNYNDMWWSSHTSIYDIVNRKLILRINEKPDIVFEFSIPNMFR